jgi:hypothetical protein
MGSKKFFMENIYGVQGMHPVVQRSMNNTLTIKRIIGDVSRTRVPSEIGWVPLFLKRGTFP